MKNNSINKQYNDDGKYLKQITPENNSEQNKFFNSSKDIEVKDLEEWNFGTDKQTADKLFNLVKKGIKTATSYLYNEETFESDNSKFSIITNWDKTEKILIETIKTNIVEFKNVSAEHAYEEGEDDRTLKSWKSLHKSFFTMLLAEKGEIFSDNIQVVCEEFKIIKILDN